VGVRGVGPLEERARQQKHQAPAERGPRGAPHHGSSRIGLHPRWRSARRSTVFRLCRVSEFYKVSELDKFQIIAIPGF